MDTLLISPTVERKVDKKPFLSWTKKSIPSSLFNKAKHSEEWHRGIEATAGVLHPSDSRFPYEFLRNHTDVYLRKKGKINQVDIDNRLATLVNTHPARDIAVAAAAHAISAKSLRSLLHAEINVAQGSYWGLETWLQCFIAAYQGNPASVTDLEAKWAQMLLPYATHGDRAAGWYLKGVSRALRKCNVRNMGVLPEYSALMTRAMTDYSTQLEGFRLKGRWVAAHEATTWMIELEKMVLAVAPHGPLLLEHIFDQQFPSWKLWANWRPDVSRITRLASHDSVRLATIPDIIALEGPDVLARSQCTLREGLISQYGSEKPWVLFGRLVIEVPDRTQEGLRAALERLTKGLESIPVVKEFSASGAESMFALFRDLTVTQPITSKGLDLFEAAIKIPHTQENDIYNTVRNINMERYSLGGQHILVLQQLSCVLDGPHAEDLRKILVQPWLVEGIEKCLKDCQTAVMTHIEMSLPWTHLATELHQFFTTILGSETICPLLKPKEKLLLDTIPSVERMGNIVDMYTAAQAQRPKASNTDSPQNAKAGEAVAEPSTKRDSQQPDLPSEQREPRHPLEPAIEAFCIRRLLHPGQIERSTQRLMNSMFHVWMITSKPQIDKDRRSLAILIAKNAKDNIDLTCRCLADIATGKQLIEAPSLVKSLVTVVTKAEEQLEQAIVECTKLLASKPVEARCWRDLLYTWLERENEANTAPIDRSLKIMKASEWIVFMGQLSLLFPSSASDSKERSRPGILDPQLVDWISQVNRFTNTLTRLENALGDHDATSLILNCGAGFWSRSSLRILECLKEAQDTPIEALMHKVVGKLSAKTQNSWEVRDCLVELLLATPDAVDACERIWDAKHGSLDIPGLHAPAQVEKAPVSSKRGLKGKASLRPTTSHSAPTNQRSLSISTSDAAPISTTKVTVPSSVAEVMVAGWIQDDSKRKTDKIAIEAFARVLNLEVYAHAIPTAKLHEAAKFWENIEKEIIKEAERLEALQKALKAKDPKGTASLLRELGVPDHSLLDEELLSLPAGVMDVVERVGDSEVEIGFPLTAYTEFQRSAMGIPKNAKAILLRLTIDHNGKAPQSFCLHFNNDANLETIEHNQWICSQESRFPHENFCKTTETAFSWQLKRILHTQLKTGTVRIADLHRFVKKQMGELGQSCISCGTAHNAANAQLRRSTPCNLIGCAQLWYQLPLHVRIPEIRTDTFAVDMMLTAVHAAAVSNRPELLPGCPIRGNEAIKTILNSLPTLTTLSHAVNLSAVLKSYHKDAEKLISWACVHFRGYLATAKGICKIPNLPSGTHQFVLANASPKMESAFVAKVPKTNAKNIVLFHGTSMDRLPAILSQGLKIFSGTALQRTGAAHGKGIYMAEEPATSLTYSPASLSWRNSGLANMRLLFGCEVLDGGRRVSPGIHVITDESTVMVRYIFFLTNSAAAPAANTIAPAMLSGMSALRTGAV